jgi:hypothetical protein
MSGQQPERYVVVDLAVLEAVRELDWVQRVDWHLLPALRATLRVVHLDPVTNRLVIAVKVARDLEEPPSDDDKHLGSI